MSVGNVGANTESEADALWLAGVERLEQTRQAVQGNAPAIVLYGHEQLAWSLFNADINLAIFLPTFQDCIHAVFYQVDQDLLNLDFINEYIREICSSKNTYSYAGFFHLKIK